MAPFPRTTALAHHKPGPGRPSSYRPEYCEMVIEAGADGFSLTAFAGMLRVSVDTVYRWMREQRDFSEAVSRASPARVLWWERKLKTSRKGAEVTASIFALRNAAPTEWRDIKHTVHDHNVKVETLTDAQLFAIASGKSLAEGSTIEGEVVDSVTR